MAKRRSLPLVAICGRPNVGKSTLFNRITGRSQAIVHDEEGITRDRFIVPAEWNGHRFRVVDTGGIIENPSDSISQKMQHQVHAAMNEADVIMLVVDGQADLTRVDYEVRDSLFRYGKPVVLAVNKLDNPKMELNRVEFYAMGLGEPYAVSSTHGSGMDVLLDAVVELLPKRSEVSPEPAEEQSAEIEPSVIKVAVVGKPNVGKSSFINAILNEDRTIVDDTPGTTRDAIDIDFTWKDKHYLFIDTAGMRKKAGIRRQVEFFSVSRSLRAIRRADICIIMVEANEGITEQDKRIFGYAMENGTAMVLAFTKWDLVEDREQRFKRLPEEIAARMPHIGYVPYITLSTTTRKRLFNIFEDIDLVAAESSKRIGTSELNQLIAEIKAAHTPPSQNAKQAKIYYATQTGVKPTTFVLFVNQKKLFHFSYVRYIENRIRERYGFAGVPIRLELREGSPGK